MIAKKIRGKIPLLLNLLAYPGTGTLLAGKYWQGGAQIFISLLGGGLMVYATTSVLLNLHNQENLDIPLYASLAAAGGWLFATIYVWAAASTWPKMSNTENSDPQTKNGRIWWNRLDP